jgi:hypothetical protein
VKTDDLVTELAWTGSAQEVRYCVAVTCPSWSYRMGGNPFRAPLSEERRKAQAEALAKARAARA